MEGLLGRLTISRKLLLISLTFLPPVLTLLYFVGTAFKLRSNLRHPR